jgi:hypothetical protein
MTHELSQLMGGRSGLGEIRSVLLELVENVLMSLLLLFRRKRRIQHAGIKDAQIFKVLSCEHIIARAADNVWRLFCGVGSLSEDRNAQKVPAGA